MVRKFRKIRSGCTSGGGLVTIPSVLLYLHNRTCQAGTTSQWRKDLFWLFR
jgi:hypothetical protein